MTSLIFEALVAGVLLGGVYGLIALGLNIIYGVLDIINFAHGAMMMMGMYLTFWLFQVYGIDPYLSILIAGPVMFVFGALVYLFLLDPMRGKALQNQFLVTLGLSLFITNAAQVLFSPDFRVLQPSYGQDVIQIGPAFVPLTRILTFVAALAATAVLLFIFQRTRLGRSIRAVAQQQEGAALCGINVRLAYTLAFALGSACVGIAGAAVTPFFYVSPTVGDLFNIASFVVVVLGGLGSMAGSLLGGLVLGITVSVGAALLPGSFKEVLMFAIFLGVLLFRPTGLLGSKA
ncbi:MAG TPA: branched-chain amino acid ABC transporter permease [Mesorhizobium sp.]